MGHEDSIVSTFMACSIVAIFAYNFYKGATSGEKIDLDNIELFTIEDNKEPARQKPKTKTAKPKTKAAKPKKKKNKQKKSKPVVQKPVEPKEPRNARGYTQLQQDCFDALKSLGIKAVREREFVISQTFNKHNPKTIQDFLQLALGK